MLSLDIFGERLIKLFAILGQQPLFRLAGERTGRIDAHQASFVAKKRRKRRTARRHAGVRQNRDSRRANERVVDR